MAEVDPGRFKAEGAALVVTRTVREAENADESAKPVFRSTVMIRDVETSSIRSSDIARTGADDGGWGVMVVPPGRSALNRGRVKQTTTFRNGEARVAYADDGGHPYVPIEATTSIGAGEVVYIGTVVRQGSGEATRTVIRDERRSAADWAEANLPGFSRQMKTRLLPPPVPTLPKPPAA